MLKVYFARWGSLRVFVNCKALPVASKLLVWLSMLDGIWVRCQRKVPLSVGVWCWSSHPHYGFEENLIEKVSTVLAAWKKLTGAAAGRQGLHQAVVQGKKKADWHAASVSLFITKSMVVLIWNCDTNLPDTTVQTLTVSVRHVSAMGPSPGAHIPLGVKLYILKYKNHFNDLCIIPFIKLLVW